jgi:hypothetical protein
MLINEGGMKNYNPLAEAGLTDLECAAELGIDKNLANTIDFNQACMEKVYKQNEFAYFEQAMDQGKSILEGERIANIAAEAGKKETLDRLADRKKRTGLDYALV